MSEGTDDSRLYDLIPREDFEAARFVLSTYRDFLEYSEPDDEDDEHADAREGFIETIEALIDWTNYLIKEADQIEETDNAFKEIIEGFGKDE